MGVKRNQGLMSLYSQALKYLRLARVSKVRPLLVAACLRISAFTMSNLAGFARSRETKPVSKVAIFSKKVSPIECVFAPCGR